MRNLDFNSWQALLSTLLGLSMISLVGIGIRLLVMQKIQGKSVMMWRQVLRYRLSLPEWFHFLAFSANWARLAKTPPFAFSFAMSASVILAPGALPTSLCSLFFFRCSFIATRAIAFSS